MTNLIAREWNGKTIRQREDGKFNLNDMAKACGKEVSDWYRNSSTKELIDAVATNLQISRNEVIEQVRGGSDIDARGTWAHRLIAIEFAGWANVQFKLQIIKWADELMETGKVELQHHPENENSLDRLEMLFEIASGMFAEYREQKKTLQEHSQKIQENSSLIEQAQENLETTINVVENLEKLVKEKKAQYSDVDNMPIALNEYCAFKNIQINKGLNGVGKALTKLCSRTGIEYFNAPVGQKNKYPFWLLKELFKTADDFECNAKSLFKLYLNNNEI